MSRQEKINIVKQLNEQGILTMKGAVSEIARQLFVSEPTVYRYLNHK
jgi:predicted transcriptional regulator YheO